MYQSLYRKYRPKNFDEVVGQEIIVKTLKNSIINDKLTHAYLFTGPRGTGKTSIAKIFAKTINCSKLENLVPCGKCDSCKQITEKQTIDIIEIDAASNNGVDEIRELRNKATLVPTVGKYKVYIIDEVHMLTTGAFNALLKTLEEPPSHIIFILATTEPHKIPQTILSRCQRFDFKKIPKQLMNEHLKLVAAKENINVENSVYKEISRLSDGCMRDALSILDQVIAYSNENITIKDIHDVNGTVPAIVLIEFLQSIVEKKYDRVFEIIEIYDNDGKNFSKLSEELLILIRNIIIKMQIPNFDFDFDTSIYDNLLKIIKFDELLHFVKIINESIYNMKKSNNTKIIFEIMIINMMNTNVITNEKPNNAESIVHNSLSKEKITENKKIEKNDKIGEVEENKNLNINNQKTIKVIDDEYLEKIKNIKKIRINNTLCNFNKKEMIALKNKISDINGMIISPEYNDIISIILDGELKAAGKDNLLFVFKSIRMEEEFNINILKIDKLLSEIFNTELKCISTNIDDWNTIKEEFNSKKKKYELMSEPIDLNTYLMKITNSNGNIDNLFGEIVEYS